MIKELFNFLFMDSSLRKEVAFLRTVALFKGLPDRYLAKVALILFKKKYLVGEKIHGNTNEANIVYIVKSGQVKLTYERSSKIIDPGGLFGEMSLVVNCRYDCDAVALKESELYFMYRARFEDMVGLNHKLGFMIMHNLASMLVNRKSCLDAKK